MLKTSKFPFLSLAVYCTVLAGLSLFVFLSTRPAAAAIFTGVMGERTRITLGYQVKPDVLRQMLPAPWQPDPADSGYLKGANLLVTFTDRIRDEDPEGKPRYGGANRYVVFLAPGRHPQTGEKAIVVLGGLAANQAEIPGYYQVVRKATVQAAHSSDSHDLNTEEVTENWEIHEAEGSGKVVFRLKALLQTGMRTQTTVERNIISAKNPALWRTYKIAAATDVVKSVPEGVDRVRDYSFLCTVPEYRQLFDGSEKLVAISVAPWYVRQIYVR